MKPGYQPTVTFPLDLAPTLEAREAVVAAFEKQTGARPTKMVLYDDVNLWGAMSADAVLLFRIPEGWTPT